METPSRPPTGRLPSGAWDQRGAAPTVTRQRDDVPAAGPRRRELALTPPARVTVWIRLNELGQCGRPTMTPAPNKDGRPPRATQGLAAV
jgi:hypothetical protein